MGHRIVPVPMETDGSGVSLEELEKAIKTEFQKKSKEISNEKFWAMFYTIPTFHNPTGACISPAKSKAVVNLARKYDILVLCDDVYNLLYYGSEPKPRLFSFDNPSDPDYKGDLKSGKLGDLAPTILNFMGVKPAEEMTGDTLI